MTRKEENAFLLFIFPFSWPLFVLRLTNKSNRNEPAKIELVAGGTKSCVRQYCRYSSRSWISFFSIFLYFIVLCWESKQAGKRAKMSNRLIPFPVRMFWSSIWPTATATINRTANLFVSSPPTKRRTETMFYSCISFEYIQHATPKNPFPFPNLPCHLFRNKFRRLYQFPL